MECSPRVSIDVFSLNYSFAMAYLFCLSPSWCDLLHYLSLSPELMPRSGCSKQIELQLDAGVELCTYLDSAGALGEEVSCQ